MAADLEEQKKAILPFMQRAQEIQQADPKVAYYCRLYAVEQAMKFPNRAKEVNALLAATLGTLERDKSRIQLDPQADRIHCEGFALRIFDNADRVDRAGKATERTSKAYYAASIFIEILNQFEPVEGDMFEKQRYCAWRAAEIRKALREGRQPTPPPATDVVPPGAGGADPLADLPPASGSSDWAYGSTFSAASGGSFTPPPPPPPLSNASSAGSYNSAQAPYQPPGAPYTVAGAQQVAPPPPPPPATVLPPPALPSQHSAGGGGSSGGPRFYPGSWVLVRAGGEPAASAFGGMSDGGGAGAAIRGTVGQVLPRPDGGFSYKVALPDRLVEVREEEAVPVLAEGDAAGWRRGGRGSVEPVRVVLVNDMSWPPTYLVQTPDGQEHAAEARHMCPAATSPATSPPAAASAPSFSYGTQSSPSAPLPHHSPASAPPPPPPPAAPAAPPAGAARYPPPAAPQAPPAYPQYQQQQPAHPPPPPPPHQQQQQPQQQQYGGQAWQPPVAVPPPGYKPSLQCITDAQKQAKYAISALSFEDIPTAVKNLTEALRQLTDPSAAAQHKGR